MTPKIRFRPSASRARRPASKRPLQIASRKKMSGAQSMRVNSANTASIMLQSHVRLADLVALGERLGAARGLDAPDLQQISAIDCFEHLPDILRDDQHRIAFGANAPHEVEHLLADHRRKTHR